MGLLLGPIIFSRRRVHQGIHEILRFPLFQQAGAEYPEARCHSDREKRRGCRTTQNRPVTLASSNPAKEYIDGPIPTTVRMSASLRTYQGRRPWPQIASHIREDSSRRLFQ